MISKKLLIISCIFFYTLHLLAQDLGADLDRMRDNINQLDQYSIEMTISQSSAYVADKKSTIEYYKNVDQYLVQEDKLKYVFNEDKILLIDGVNKMLVFSKKQPAQKSFVSSMMHPAFVPLIDQAQLIDVDNYIKYYRADQGATGNVLEIWYNQQTKMISELKYSNKLNDLSLGMTVLGFVPDVILADHHFDIDTYLSTDRQEPQKSGIYADYELRSDLNAQ